MLTISKLKRWSINYYIDTAQAAEHAAKNLARVGGGLGEYYSGRDTRTPVWLCAGDTRTTAALVGLTDVQRAGGDADSAVVARWRRPVARSDTRCREHRGVAMAGAAPFRPGAGKTTSIRALVSSAHRSRRTVLVLAPTGKAVDVAVREGAGDTGHTIAKAVQSLQNNALKLDRQTMVVVDKAGMVGTDDLRELLTVTTAAGAETVLVGDAHQLAPVKARGGMFAQLCTDLPWTQQLSEVWRMRDPEERVASVALRDGGPAPVRRAISWYRTHDRLHTGDPIAMAHDVLAAYRADTAAGKDALLVYDTTEVADALNHRLHNETIGADAPTVTAARGHRIGVGDLIITRRNDPAIGVFDPADSDKSVDPVRNGNRWRVYAVDPEGHRVAARRLDDGAAAAFSGEYLGEYVTHGYAVTVHAAQGVTADTTHAALGENTTRSMLYVAMTRGRDANTAYLYERMAEQEYGPDQRDGVHVMQRGISPHAGQLVRAILANRDDQPITAHDIAVRTPRSTLPEWVRHLVDRRAASVRRRRASYDSWQAKAPTVAQSLDKARERETSERRTLDHGLDLWARSPTATYRPKPRGRCVKP